MKLLSKLISFSGLKKTGTEPVDQQRITDDELNQAIDHVVDSIYEKIRYYPAYKKILGNSVLTSLIYIDKLIESIPGPLQISNKTFSTHAKIRSYFSSLSTMHEIFNNSSELRDFVKEPMNSNLDEVYALLCMHATEKTVFGMTLQDDIIQRDVRQKTLNFTDHNILSPAATEHEVRNGIKQCIFDGLITYALQQILKVEERKQGLTSQRSALKARLTARQSEAGGLNQLLATASGNTEPDIEHLIQENENKLSQLPASWDTPKYYIEMIKEILQQPEQFIRISSKSFNLSKTGVTSTAAFSEPADTIAFNEIVISNVLQRVVEIVRYPRNDIREKQKFHSQ
ncbi:MAG: hypothetical protein OEY11_12910 [Gammaproteobacteria bacterium]|nr:hypothetical protein [Gammaproteobacteria bacterium]